jgi:diguanylate cyclase (GGDEF)-like protein
MPSSCPAIRTSPNATCSPATSCPGSTTRRQETVAVWDDSAAELAKESPDPVWLQDNISLWLHNMFGHDEVFILGGDDEPVHALSAARRVPVARYWKLSRDLAPLVHGVRGRTESPSGRHDRRPGRPLAAGASVLTTGRTSHVSGLIWVDGRPAAASAMIVRESTPGYVRQRGDWPVLISVRYLDGSFLSELSSRHLIEAPRFSRTGERRMGEQAAPLLDDSGRPVGHLVWKPELPGSGILGTLAPLTGGLALFMCLITGALARRLIRTTTELAEAEARSSHLAFHDALTGLPNRALLADRLERALTNATDDARAALLLVDLDRFKQVNDTLGHQAGDALIVLFADRLAALAGERDTVARLGGDEFAIVALGREARGVEDLCARILRAAAASFDLAGGTVHVGASIGVATAGRCDATELTRRADVALYAAKEDGRGVARIFSAELDTAVRERAALEEELRRALAAGELHVWFQPQVCRKGRVVGLEALARWQHPTRGLIGPDRFIKAAEDTGLIVEIGELVMREAAAMSARSLAGTSRPPTARAGRRGGDPSAGEATLHVGQALAHGREMLGGLHGIVEARFPRACSRSSRPANARCIRLGPGVEEASAELRLQLDLGGDALLEADHLGPGQKGHHRPAEGEQPVAQRSAAVVEQQLPADVLALMLHRGGEQAALVPK